jgi:hypothetical protein
MHYRGYEITQHYRSGPFAFIYQHEDFCCPECDNRSGSATSFAQTLKDIDELEEEFVTHPKLLTSGTDARVAAVVAGRVR